MNKTSKGLNRYEIHLTDTMLEEIESIATMEGAKVHHISKKPIIKDTVISLLELGIKAVFEGVDLPKKPNTSNTDTNNRIDLTVLDSRIEEKLNPLYSLISELSDKINRIGYTVNDNDTDTNNRIDLPVLTDNELIGVEKTEDNLATAILANIKKEETTNDSTLSESPNLPLNEDSPQIVPTEENKPENEDKPEITKEMVIELLKKHHLTFTGVVKNTAVLLPFLTELNQMQGKTMKITSNNISKVAKKEDKSYIFPFALWECLEVENKGTKKKASYVWTIKPTN